MIPGVDFLRFDPHHDPLGRDRFPPFNAERVERIPTFSGKTMAMDVSDLFGVVNDVACSLYYKSA